MSSVVRLPVRTASDEQSIWQDLSEITFRKHIVALEKASKEVPAGPQVHSLPEWQQQHQGDGVIHQLPVEVEQRIADDFAFIAATEDNAKAVSAVGLEERPDVAGMIVRLAGNGPLPPQTAESLQAVLDDLGQCASKSWYYVSCTRHFWT